MRVLGCLGMIASFTAGCAVTFGIMSLRPLADPIGQAFFQAASASGGNGNADASTESEPSLLKQVTDGLQVLTSSIRTESNTRTWTHRDGRQIRATILSAGGNTVTIRREGDGRVFTMRQDSLSTADREFVQRWLLGRDK